MSFLPDCRQEERTLPLLSRLRGTKNPISGLAEALRAGVLLVRDDPEAADKILHRVREHAPAVCLVRVVTAEIAWAQNLPRPLAQYSKPLHGQYRVLWFQFSSATKNLGRQHLPAVIGDVWSLGCGNRIEGSVGVNLVFGVLTIWFILAAFQEGMAVSFYGT